MVLDISIIRNFKLWFCDWKFRIRILDFGIWNSDLCFAVWKFEIRSWNLEFKIKIANSIYKTPNFLFPSSRFQKLLIRKKQTKHNLCAEIQSAHLSLGVTILLRYIIQTNYIHHFKAAVAPQMLATAISLGETANPGSTCFSNL